MILLAMALAVQEVPLRPATVQQVPAAQAEPPRPNARILRKPAPTNNPQSWVGPDDYPAPALRNRESGTVGFELYLDTAGVPYWCRITLSSGSALLDATACRLLKQRARFSPALGKRKRPVASTWASRFRWELPPKPEPLRLPPASGAAISRIVVSPDGTLLSCVVEQFGQVPANRGDDCESAAQMPRAAFENVTRGATGPVTVVIVWRQEADGVPAPFDEAKLAGLTLFDVRRGRYEVDESGEVTRCDEEAIGPNGYHSVPCSDHVTFIGDSRPHVVRVRVSRGSSIKPFGARPAE